MADAVGGILIVGRVTEVDVRKRTADPQTGEARKDVHTVFVAGPRAVEETWGEDGGFVEGQLVCLRCVPQLPSEKQHRLTWRRLVNIPAESVLDLAKAMAADRK